jgi:MFS family permease
MVVVGQIISLFGSAILRFALDLYVLDITGRADIFAAVIAISAMPGIVFTPIGGAIADRFSKRNLMVVFDFSSGAVVIVMLLLMSIGNASVAVIGVILTALSVISSMYQPTVQASIPVMVGEKRLAGANGIISGIASLAGFTGPVLGGAFYGLIGLKPLVVLSCAAFLLSAVMEIFIHIPFEKRDSGKPIVATIWDDIKDGCRYVTKEMPVIFKVLMLAAAINLLFTPAMIIGVPYILRVIMRSGDILYGVGMGLIQVSTIIGALSAGFFTKKLLLSNIYRPLMLIAAILLPMAFSVAPPMLGLGYWPSFTLFFAGEIANFAIGTVLSIFVITEVQKMTPREMLGKVMSIVFAVSQIAAPLGLLIYGGVYQIFSGTAYVPILITSFFMLMIAFMGKQTLKKETGEI